MRQLDYLAVDADNHYYEPDDCCTRYLDPRFRDRAVHVVRAADGSGEWRFGDKPLSFHRGARDQVMEPGAYRAFMSGTQLDPSAPPKFLPSDSPAFRNRDARLNVMDRFHLQAVLMIPSFGLAFEADCKDDPEAACANLSAFNRWVEDDWGYAYRERIFAPAMISLLDRDRAVAELDRVLAAGARMLLLRAGPLYSISPADPYFDPFWSRVNEARIPVILHIGISGYNPVVAAMWGEDPNVSEQEMPPFQFLTCFGKRPIMDMVACLILHNLFGRYPDLRMLSIENGSTWVPDLLKDMDKSAMVTVSTQGAKRTKWLGGPITDRPSELFKRYFWVAPFYEDPVPALVERIGAERVLFGSDWPHPEGVREPLDFVQECDGLAPGPLRRVMRDNAAELLGLAPGGRSATGVYYSS